MGNCKFAAAYRKKRSISRHAVGEGFYPSRAGRTIKNIRTPGAFVPCRRGIFVFAIAYCREGQSPSPTQIRRFTRIRRELHDFADVFRRADRGVRPYRTLCGVAENACNFVFAHCRVDVGIDPYGCITLLPFVARVCDLTWILQSRGFVLYTWAV